MKHNLTYFLEPEFTISSSFSEADNGVLCKKALVLVEGTHKDNKQRTHTFSKDRLYKIAANSNALFERGTRIPLLEDHNKTQASVVGDIESNFVVKEITEENLPNAKHKHLIGRLGLFVDNILVKSKKAIEQAKEGLLNTISPGIDVLTDTIREVSFTPTPAIVGLSMFNRHALFQQQEAGMSKQGSQSQALSFDELEQEQSDLTEVKNDYEDLCAKLWTLTENVLTLPDEVMQGLDRQQLLEEIIGQFFERYTAILGMGEGEEQMDEYQDPRMMMNSPMYPGMGGVSNRLQGAYPSPYGNRPGTAYSDDAILACFSMAEMEKTIAEFGYRKAFKWAARNLRNRNLEGGKSLGEIGKRFGQKMLYATRGKLAKARKLGSSILRGTPRDPGRPGTSGAPASSVNRYAMSQRQRQMSARAKKEYGVVNKPKKKKRAGTPMVNVNEPARV